MLRKLNSFKSCAIEWRGTAVTATLPLSYLWLLLPARPAFPWVAARLGAPVFVKAAPILSVVETVHYLTKLRRAVARTNLYLEAIQHAFCGESRAVRVLILKINTQYITSANYFHTSEV
jgi:hypothetical protein